MDTTRLHGIRLGAALGLLAAGFGAGPLAAADLASYRAYYSLGLAAAASGAVVDVRGVARISQERTCDGWIMNQKMSFELDTGQRTITQVFQFSGWESGDGKSYRFVSHQQLGSDSETFQGRATLKGAAEGGAVIHSQPAGKTILLPPGTMFPMGHLRWLLDQAAAGARQASRVFFEGSDGKGPREVVAFIGRRVEPDARRSKALGPLAARPGWRMRFAFYPVGSTVSTPEYEVQLVQLDNGVGDALVLDFGPIKVNLKLEKVEALPPPAC